MSINHLSLNENDIGEYRTFFRLSPPLRREEDRAAMVEALADGTIDIIVSSHDPQDADTKRRPFAEAESGAIGLETLLPAALRLHHSGAVPLSRIVEALTAAPAKLLGLDRGTLAPGSVADMALVDLEAPLLFSEDRHPLALQEHRLRERPLPGPGLADLRCRPHSLLGIGPERGLNGGLGHQASGRSGWPALPAAISSARFPSA